jgi:hypothetical protein
MALLTIHASALDFEDAVLFTPDGIMAEDMRAPSETNIRRLGGYLERFPGLDGLAPSIIDAQERYGVNAVLLLAIIRLESGNGTSTIAHRQNNIAGIVSTRSTPERLIYVTFESKEACVAYLARLLSRQYLSVEGRFHRGYTLEDIAKSYSEAPEFWANAVAELMLEIQRGV